MSQFVEESERASVVGGIAQDDIERFECFGDSFFARLDSSELIECVGDFGDRLGVEIVDIGKVLLEDLGIIVEFDRLEDGD